MKKRSMIYRKWFKVLLVGIMFLPVFTEIPYDPENTMNVISEVLENPLIYQVKWLFPVTKALLAAAIAVPFFIRKNSAGILLTYYAIVVFFVGIFQNMGYTQYGFTFMFGNMLAEFVIIFYCLYDMIKSKSKFGCHDCDKTKLWLFPFMLLSLAMPYKISNGIIVPGLNGIFVNEPGVTYCMITPVVTGILIIFHKGVHKPTLNAVSFLGLGFAILNMLAWFVFEVQNWWMGVLHLPLLITSICGLAVSKA